MEAKDLWFFVAGIVASMIINYITQFTSTPLARKFAEWRSQITQKQALRSVKKATVRFEKINREFSTLQLLTEQPLVFQALTARILQRLLLRIVFLIFYVAAGYAVFNYSDVLKFLWLTIFLFLFFAIGKEDSEMGARDIFKKLVYFEEYKKRTLDQLAELRKVLEGTEQQLTKNNGIEEEDND